MADEKFNLVLDLPNSESDEDELDAVSNNVQEVIDTIRHYYPAAVAHRDSEELTDDDPDTLVVNIFKDRFAFQSFWKLIRDVLFVETCPDHQTRLYLLAGKVGCVCPRSVADVAVIEDAFASHWAGLRPIT